MGAWPALVNVSIGSKLSAAQWNSDVDAAIGFLENPPRCQVKNSIAVSTTSGTALLLTADTENYDTDTMHSLVSNTSRVVANTPGLYDVKVIVSFVANATGYRAVDLRKNAAGASGGGTDIVQVNIASFQAVAPTVVAFGFEVQLALNDYLELFAVQNSGGALNATLLSFSARAVAST